jgi:hypothetical protein
MFYYNELSFRKKIEKRSIMGAVHARLCRGVFPRYARIGRETISRRTAATVSSIYPFQRFLLIWRICAQQCVALTPAPTVPE